MNLAIIFVIGIVIGVIGAKLFYSKDSIGTLRVDQSDPTEPPYLFLELKDDLRRVYQKEYVTLKVEIKNYISHK